IPDRVASTLTIGKEPLEIVADASLDRIRDLCLCSHVEPIPCRWWRHCPESARLDDDCWNLGDARRTRTDLAVTGAPVFAVRNPPGVNPQLVVADAATGGPRIVHRL